MEHTTSLLCSDDKRFVLDDGVHTLAYFHKDLKKLILTDDHKKEEIFTKKKDSKKFHKKKRFSQIIINKSFKKILTKRDSYC